MDEMNSGSSDDITINFTDPLGLPITPNNVAYTVIDYFTGHVIVKELVNTPRTDSIDIRLDKTINTIINPLYDHEIRLVTFEYDYNATDTKTEEYIYKLINLEGIPMEDD